MSAWGKGSLTVAAAVSVLAFLAALPANTVSTALVRAGVVFVLFLAVAAMAGAVLHRVLAAAMDPVTPHEPKPTHRNNTADDKPPANVPRASDPGGFAPLDPPRLNPAEAGEVRRVVSTVRRMMEEES